MGEAKRSAQQQTCHALRTAKQTQVETQGGCGALIPGLPNEVALRILVMLPRALHGSLRCVCSAWKIALQPLSVNALRNSLCISETWLVLVFDNLYIAFCDPLLRRLSSPIPLYQDHIFVGHVLCAIGKQVFTTRDLLHPSTLKCFDAASMQWQTQSDSIPLWDDRPKYGGTSTIAAIDGHVYVIARPKYSNEDDMQITYKKAARFNVKTKTWEKLPYMHQEHIDAAIVSLQGCIHVIGGWGYGDFVQCGEIWDPRSQEWMLEPELWPERLFNCYAQSNVAVVLDTLYALKVERTTYGTGADNDWELWRYVSASKIWISLGIFSFKAYCCRCDLAKACQLIGAGKELWVIVNCCTGGQTCAAQILSCVPTALPLRWQSVPITSSVEFPLGYATVVGNVHV